MLKPPLSSIYCIHTSLHAAKPQRQASQLSRALIDVLVCYMTRKQNLFDCSEAGKEARLFDAESQPHNGF